MDKPGRIDQGTARRQDRTRRAKPKRIIYRKAEVSTAGIGWADQ